MAIFRNVNMSFWTDPKVVDDYTPEDRYFMLYALTNNYTNIIGCYEISIKQMSNDLGYNKDTVEKIINRFKEIHKTIDYDFDTKELLVVNWYKYNWSASPKLDNPLYVAIEKVKSDLFHDKLATIYNNRESVIKEKDTISIPYRYGIDTTITITNTIPISIPISNSISNNNIYNNNINNINNNELEEEFNIIWTNYPRKQGKAKALKSYIKARKKGVTKEIIYNGLKNYLRYIEIGKVETQYIKQGSTWFNQECWNDDYSINNNSNTYKRNEVVPDWLNKNIKYETASPEEIKELENSLSEFKDPDFEERKAALQEKLKNKYKK
jgi:hypothetical protein